MANLTDTEIQTATSSTPDWRDAADALMAALIANMECFSSGEIARHLRLNCSDLRFSVPGLGSFIRDQFYSGALPQYPDDGMGGGPVDVSQMPRTTQGLYPNRTAAGVEVFVYCPDQAMGDVHEFEVYVPKPGQDATMDPNPAQVTNPIPQPSQVAQAVLDGANQAAAQNDDDDDDDGDGYSAAPLGKPQVVIAGAPSLLNDFRATVHADRRLCVGRSAFEAAVHRSGKPMRGGDPVYVTVKTDEATLSQSPTGDPDEKTFNLVTDRGRVLFPSADPTTPFVPGTVYHVTVGAGTMTVDLSKAVNN